MSLSALELVSTGVLALLTESTDMIQAQSVVLDDSAPLRGSTCATALGISPMLRRCGFSASDVLESYRLTLDLSWKTRRSASDVLTDLLDVDGIRVVAERRLWDRPDVLALRHDFGSDRPLHLYCAAGIERVGAMAEVGASWRLTGRLDVESDIRWVDLGREAQLVRTDAGWGSGDAAMTLSLVWRGR